MNGVCRLQSCYSKKDCQPEENCLKWPEFQASGICYKEQCQRSIQCPSGMMCDSKRKICIKAPCKDDNCCRFHCHDGEMVPKKCTNDFECGYKVITNKLFL